MFASLLVAIEHAKVLAADGTDAVVIELSSPDPNTSVVEWYVHNPVDGMEFLLGEPFNARPYKLFRGK